MTFVAVLPNIELSIIYVLEHWHLSYTIIKGVSPKHCTNRNNPYSLPAAWADNAI